MQEKTQILIYFFAENINRSIFAGEKKHNLYIMELRVKEICKERGILFKDLAAKLGVTDVSLRSTIQGNPTISSLEKIADALGVEVAELFRPSDNAKIICPHCGKPIIIKAEK